MVKYHTLILSVLLGFLAPGTHGQDSYTEKIQNYRDSIDTEFRDSVTSILQPEDLSHFKALDYFNIDPNYCVMARFKKIKNGRVVTMKTSGTRTPSYRPYGILHFKLNGEKCKLTLYQSADPGRPELKKYLLLAFTDLTNGFDTYGGGRYIEYSTDDVKSEMVLDFNYCFNPYCAYSHKFSCVIPPAENALNVKINAGVKKFHD